MFFDLVRRNSRRSRKENGLFFLSLLISIIAFYIILSLSQQDVMRFLKQMESDAVNRLLTIVPVFYCLTLLIVFFLVYYASKYQLERRRHEFGVYLMMGMSRKKTLFPAFVRGSAKQSRGSRCRTSYSALLIGAHKSDHREVCGDRNSVSSDQPFLGSGSVDGCRVCGGQADGVCHPQRKNCTSGDRRSAAARAGGNQNAENACHLPFGSAVGRSAANRGVYSGDPGIFLGSRSSEWV